MKPQLPASSRSDETASQLRSEIFSGAAEPRSLLAESAVARRLGVSRVPVREALFALEREGLVQFSATGRAFVKELAPQDFEELYTLRLALEPLAARLATSRLRDDAVLLEMNIAATRRARSVQEVTQLDLEFHQLILEASGNARLLNLWRSLRGELQLWLGRLHRTHQFQTRATREQTVEAHSEVLQYFKKQTSNSCERLMRNHIQGCGVLPLSA
jgi:DNA-binding GntR family transcriptional regulator